MKVRRITSGDTAVLKRVRLAALQDTPSAFGSTYDSEAGRSDAGWSERAVAGSSGSDRATYFAEIGDEIVGLAGGYREEPSSAIVELVSMWVAPHVRGRGVGARLIEAVSAWAIETNAAEIALWVTEGNRPAERLYASMGFVATGAMQRLPSDPSRDEVRMTRSTLSAMRR